MQGMQGNVERLLWVLLKSEVLLLVQLFRYLELVAVLASPDVGEYGTGTLDRFVVVVADDGRNVEQTIFLASTGDRGGQVRVGDQAFGTVEREL